MVEAFNPTDPTHPSNIGPSHDEYYPTIAFNALLVVLTDPSLSDHHTAVVDAIMYIFRSLRLKVVTFLPQVSIISRNMKVFRYSSPISIGLPRFPQRHENLSSRITRILFPKFRITYFHGQATRQESPCTHYGHYSRILVVDN
jgi:phosphatidylinositol kinase/protein kinase (PI-3  family)